MRWTNEVRDSLWLMGLQGVNYLAPLLVWPYLMSVLGATQFGIFSFGIALAQYLMMLVDFGFNLTATKQIALAQGDSEATNRLFSATMTAKILLLLLSGVVAAGVTFIPAYAVYRPVVRITWLMVVGHTFSLFWLYQGAGRIRWVAVCNAVMKLLILPLTFLLVGTPADVYTAAWIQVAVFLGAGFILPLLARLLGLAHFVPVAWTDVRAQFRSSWDVFLSNAATSTYTVLFVVLVAWFVSAEEVGRYAAAEKIMRCTCYLIWIPVSQAFFPRVSRLGTENRAEGLRLVGRLTVVMAVALGLAGVGMALCVEPIAGLLGREYGGIGTPAALMALMPMLVGIGGVQGQMGLIALGGERQQKQFRNVYLCAGAAALVSVCLFTALWGVTGAAAAVTLTETIVCIGMWHYNRKQ